MITTLSTQVGRRYPQMGSTWTTFVGRLLSVGTSGAGPATTMIAMEHAFFRRVFGRIWGRVN